MSRTVLSARPGAGATERLRRLVLLVSRGTKLPTLWAGRAGALMHIAGAAKARLAWVTGVTTLAGVFASVAIAGVVNTGEAQCCSSIVPDMPLPTYYGATLFRTDDPRSAWKPYLATLDDPPATIPELLADIDNRELQAGPMGAELTGPLGWLGTAYLANDRYAEAVESLRRGIHLARINDGLYTPLQTPLLEQLILAHIRQGDYAAADEQQRYLYRVLSWHKEPDDPELLTATLRYADWLRTAYLGDLGSKRYVRLVALNDLFMDAIESIEELHGKHSPLLLPYLQGRAELSYLISVYPGEADSGFRAGARDAGDFQLAEEAQLRFFRLRDGNFRYGLRALEHREAILKKTPGRTAEDLANARLAIADWHQWHRRYAQAIRTYKEAWALIAETDSAETWLEATLREPLELPRETIFNPGSVPIQTLNSAEISVNFTVTRHGEAREITFVTPRTEDTQVPITRAYHYLRNTRFRPRLEDGLIVDAENLQRVYQIRY